MSEELMKILLGFFTKLQRQGPGSNDATLKALSFIKSELPPHPTIADIGCGTGAQTACLVEQIAGAKITAIDLFDEMLERMPLHENITTLRASMDELDIEPESLDVIWSEGAIYNIGFENGLTLWQQFIKPGGYIAVSDCVWLSDQRPVNSDYIESQLAGIDSISNKIRVMEKCGYEPLACFTLPSECWTTNYYEPVSEKLEELLAEYPNNAEAEAFVDGMRAEVEMYKESGKYYSYAFFVGKKL